MSRNKDNDRKTDTSHDKEGKAVAAAERDASPSTESTVDKTGALKRAPTHENRWSKGAKKT